MRLIAERQSACFFVNDLGSHHGHDDSYGHCQYKIQVSFIDWISLWSTRQQCLGAEQKSPVCTFLPILRTDIWCSSEENPTSEKMGISLSHLENKIPHLQMAEMIETANIKCWWECRAIRTIIYGWWWYKMVQPLWKTLWQFFMKWNLHLLLWPNNFTLRYLPKRNKNLYPQKDLYKNIYSSLKLIMARNHGRKRVEQFGFVLIMEQYSAIKGNEPWYI